MDLLLGKFNNKKAYFFLFLFLITVFFRSPTLFNDYYDVDELAAIIQAKEYISGDVAGVDFKESKKYLYHLIFKSSYKISVDHGWVLVHLISIFIVFLTSVFIFLIGKEFDDFNTGALAALFYSILISSFGRHFMAVNGEIIYNLPIIIGLYFFLKSFSSKKYLFFPIAILSGYAAYNIKFHGIILILYILFFMSIVYPFIKGGIRQRYFKVFFYIFLLGIFLFFIDLISLNNFAGNIIYSIKTKLFYFNAAGRKFTFSMFFIRFIHRQGLLLLWHLILWVPFFVYIYNLVRVREREDSIYRWGVILFAVVTYLMIFGGGARLYFHYFMAVYPAAAIVSAYVILKMDFKGIQLIKKRSLFFLLIPALFFFSWNVKDVLIKHFYQEGFYKEGRVLYWTRAALAGHLNDYLLPESSYLDAVNYIRLNSEKDDRIYVWGDGPYINYFSNRGMGGYTLWPKNTFYKIWNDVKKGDKVSLNRAYSRERHIIFMMEKKKPVYFVDLFYNGLSYFDIPLTAAPHVYEYVMKNYKYVKTVNKIMIYKRIE